MDHSNVPTWSLIFLSWFRDGGGKRKGRGVVYMPRCFILYQHLSLNLFPPCLAAVLAVTQQEKLIGSQTLLETFHSKYWLLTGMQSRLQSSMPVPGPQQLTGSPSPACHGNLIWRWQKDGPHVAALHIYLQVITWEKRKAICTLPSKLALLDFP